MTSIPRKELIEDRLNKALSPSYLEVLDESDQHIGHAGHQGGHRHFAIRIKAAALHNLTRIGQHRKIYDLFTDLMPNEIPALRIEIIK